MVRLFAGLALFHHARQGATMGICSLQAGANSSMATCRAWLSLPHCMLELFQKVPCYAVLCHFYLHAGTDSRGD